MGIPMSLVWLAGMLVFAIVEAATLGLTAIWFAFGSLVAMLAALIGWSLWIQLVVFIVASGVFLAFTRPIAKKYLKLGRERTNADRLILMNGVVTETVDNQKAAGQVRVNGQIWSASSVDGCVLPEGKKIRVKEIKGVRLLVEAYDEQEEKIC